MVGTILTSSQNAQLFAIQQTVRDISTSQKNLASGLRVNSALDNSQSFFTSLSLRQSASNLGRVLDGISQGIRGIQEAENGLRGLSDIVGNANNNIKAAQEDLLSNRQDLGAQILADNPVIYYRLDETSGITAQNLGSGGVALNGIYQAGVSQNAGALHFGIDNTSVRLDGLNDRIAIPNNVLVNTSTAGYAERTVELTFEADNLGGRQVLFEEGGTGNAAAIYLDDDQIYFVARDAGDFGPFNISATIQEGQVYQAAFVLDANAGTFTGYLDGEAVGEGSINRPLSRHGGAVAIGRNSGGTFFHDGANGGNGEYFSGRISDFALYNSVLSESTLQGRFDATQLTDTRRYEQEITRILDQIDPFVADASYRGINLLNNDYQTTYFNASGSSSLSTQGADLTSSGLGFAELDFQTLDSFNQGISNFESALDTLKSFGQSLSVNFNIIRAREDFTADTINNFKLGSDDLVLADLNKESVNLLALQTQQSIQIETLSLSARGSNIADFLSQDPFLDR